MDAHLKGKKLTMTGVSLDSLDDTKKFFQSQPAAFNVLLPDADILRSYPVTSVPLVMLISGRGIVEWTHKGRINEGNWSELQSKL